MLDNLENDTAQDQTPSDISSDQTPPVAEQNSADVQPAEPVLAEEPKILLGGEPLDVTEKSSETSDVLPVVKTKRSKKKFTISIIIFLLVVAAGAVYYFYFFNKSAEFVERKVTPSSAVLGFATYKETPVAIKPAVAPYKIASDLSNIDNTLSFYQPTGQYNGEITNEMKASLAKNSFVVSRSKYGESEFFKLYEPNRYRYIPNFITSDSMLHNYHLMFDFLLENVEEEYLAAELKTLSANMLAESISQYNSVKGTKWENAAKRNVGFFAVGAKLQNPSTVVPDIVKTEVDKELALIDAHNESMIESPVMNIGTKKGASVGGVSLEQLKEDYTQYVPRGHYDKSDLLKAYFRSMMWYGRLSFRIKNEDEIKSGVLITLALNDKKNKTSWDKIYEPINFFVGKSDDITYYDFEDLVVEVYGTDAALKTVSTDAKRLALFVTKANALDPPKINSMPIFDASIQTDRDKEIKAFRFMGQRFTLDASIFQRLVYREVGDVSSKRMLPKALDIPAAMGSEEALKILTADGETKYKNYSENMASMKSYIAKLPMDNWSQNLYCGWLFMLKPLTEEVATGYPTFMQNDAWTRKQLNTFLGSWTELKHDTILYSKQVYAEAGGGDEVVAHDDRGYVEPVPYVYARLTSLLDMTISGLDSRGLLSTTIKADLTLLKELSLSLKTISEKELRNEVLTDSEYELIRSYGAQLEHFWLQVMKNDPTYMTYGGPSDYLSENPLALIADVATDPNGTVLEEATGYVSPIYVVFPIDGKLRIAKGGVYSYYEFTQPSSNRLTDKEWRTLLRSKSAPGRPAWTNTFTAQSD